MSDAPARIGKYQILSTLGEGAMGIVYLAHDPFIDRKVALKTIRKHLLDGKHAAQLVARFRQEAMAAGRLNHPGIVAVYDYGEDEATAYIVMEYAPGEELEAIAGRRPLTLPEIAGVMRELGEALQFAHDAGIVHRDIKPSNLLMSGGRLKITDFGIARLSTSDLTQHGATLGTPRYMAPEQYTGGPVDHRVDIFASGVILYELLTRRLPFDGPTIHALAYQISFVEPPAPSTIAPHLPGALDAVLARALAKNREARFSSARELAAAVAAAIAWPDVVTMGTAPPNVVAMGTTPPNPVAMGTAPPNAVAMGTAPPNPDAPPPSGTVLATGTLADAAAQGWTTDRLRALETALAPTLGAVAGPLVRRSAAKTRDPQQLLSLLVAAVDERARSALFQSLQAALGVAPTTAVGPAGAAPPSPGRTIGEQLRAHTPEDVERLTQALAPFIGPIAKIMVTKAAAQVKGYRELCLKVSERLPSPEERARFLAKVDGR